MLENHFRFHSNRVIAFFVARILDGNVGSISSALARAPWISREVYAVSTPYTRCLPYPHPCRPPPPPRCPRDDVSSVGSWRRRDGGVYEAGSSGARSPRPRRRWLPLRHSRSRLASLGPPVALLVSSGSAKALSRSPRTARRSRFRRVAPSCVLRRYRGLADDHPVYRRNHNGTVIPCDRASYRYSPRYPPRYRAISRSSEESRLSRDPRTGRRHRFPRALVRFSQKIARNGTRCDHRCFFVLSRYRLSREHRNRQNSGWSS